MKLTPELIAELRNAYAAATPGEWQVAYTGNWPIGVGAHSKHANCNIYEMIGNPAELRHKKEQPGDRKRAIANSKFIAAVHNALPAILADLDRLRDALDPFAARWHQCVRDYGEKHFEGRNETEVMVNVNHLKAAALASKEPAGETDA